MSKTACRVLVTGANYFIGKPCDAFGELDQFTTLTFVREDPISSLIDHAVKVDTVVHLAGETGLWIILLEEVNTGLTQILCDAVRAEYVKNGRKVRVILLRQHKPHSTIHMVQVS